MKNEKETVLLEEIRSYGWKQGSLLLSCPKELAGKQSEKENLYLLITHSCDIMHHSFTDEKYAEAILAKAIKSPDGQLTYGKNPRKIHIDLCNSGKIEWYELSTSNRVFFNRKKLAILKPSPIYKISKNTLENVIDWLSKKYDRIAFPDAFNNRMAKHKSKNKIKKILERKGHDIKGLFVKLNSYDELSDNQPYEISLYMIIDEDVNNDNLKFTNILESIVTNLDNNPGIHVQYYNVSTLDEITAKEFLDLDHWDFDYLSSRDKPGGKTVASRK